MFKEFISVQFIKAALVDKNEEKILNIINQYKDSYLKEEIIKKIVVFIEEYANKYNFEEAFNLAKFNEKETVYNIRICLLE
jgi:predicted transcriptional regulator